MMTNSNDNKSCSIVFTFSEVFTLVTRHWNDYLQMHRQVRNLFTHSEMLTLTN